MVVVEMKEATWHWPCLHLLQLSRTDAVTCLVIVTLYSQTRVYFLKVYTYICSELKDRKTLHAVGDATAPMAVQDCGDEDPAADLASAEDGVEYMRGKSTSSAES